MNVALIQSRRKYPDQQRLFSVPGVPWVPLVAVGSNIVLLTSLELVSVVLGLGAVVVGIVFWFGVLD